MVTATDVPAELLTVKEDTSVILDTERIDAIVHEVNMNWPEYPHTPVWDKMQAEKGRLSWGELLRVSEENHKETVRRKKAYVPQTVAEYYEQQGLISDKFPNLDDVSDILANIGEDSEL